jgi:hypothetical protein
MAGEEMKLLQLIAAVLLLAVSLFAADVSGTWSGDVKLPNGQLLPFVAHLKQDGAKITGKLDGINGAPDVEILNGKIEGDTVTFQGVRKINGADVKFNYTAKASGDMLDFKIVREDGQGPPLGTLTIRKGN